MRKIDQIKPDGNNIPIHVQAAQHGANIGALKRDRVLMAGARRKSASEIQAAWDYRSAGLTVDRARKLIEGWYDVTAMGRHNPSSMPYQGRIVSMASTAYRIRNIYVSKTAYISAQLSKTDEYRPGHRLMWDSTTCKISTPSGRVIFVRRIEDVTWDNSRSGRRKQSWPSSKSVSYRSHLLRSDWRNTPGTRRLIEIAGLIEYQTMEAISGRIITHDARGNWARRIVSELLGEAEAVAYEAARAEFLDAESEAHAENDVMPRPAYKIVEQNGCLRSVFSPTTIYPLGEWVADAAQEDHGGGLYCYLNARHAVEDARMGEIFKAAWTAGKTLVICRCEAAGKHIEYGRKYAFDRLRIVEVLQPITSN